MRPKLGQIGYIFLRYANTVLGGGSATIAVLHQHVVQIRSWITETQFDLIYALSRATPGTNLLAFGTAVGWLTRGWKGALIALLAASLPCALLAVALTVLYEGWHQNTLAISALRGAVVASVGLMVFTAWQLLKIQKINSTAVRAILVAAAALLLSQIPQLVPLHILGIAALFGFIFPERPK